MGRSTAYRIVLEVAVLFSFAGVASGAAVAPYDPARPTTAATSTAQVGSAAFAPVNQPDPVIRWMVDRVKQEAVQKYVSELSGAAPAVIGGSTYTIATRHMQSGTPIQKATSYVGEHLASLGLQVEHYRWGPPTAPDVVGQKTGITRPGDIYMITAHLDDLPAEIPAPGADDNASGMTAVMVAADILSQFTWDCTLRFAFWTGEEQGFLGSDAYAERASLEGESILGVLNLDMIGWNHAYPTPDIDLHSNPDIPATVDLANQFASVVDAYGLDLVPEVRADGMGTSDHVAFWKYGYNAILGIEDYYPDEHDFNPYYDKVNDTVLNLDMAYLTEYVRAVVAEMPHMAGCLSTGQLAGAVTAAHDRSPITGAEIEVLDGAGRRYVMWTGADGRFSQPVPPGTYSGAVSAYGFSASAWLPTQVSTGASVTRDSELVALPPAAPVATAMLDAGEVTLGWEHVSPDTSYQVRRSTDPYFAAVDGELLETISAKHPPAAGERLAYRDAASAVGDASTNHFYVVLGMNAAGTGAESRHTGEFDFALSRPAGSQ